ncbi:MAG: glycosyltransferase family 2 protein [Bradymonadaceae bacterium]|nr:glycosyltransferase family 2 protein [Lujinxingiaceae bacterium]
MSKPQNPLVSVVTPCFNAAATLPRALASLRAQTESSWECIVVDDGSSDDLGAVIEAVADARVRLERLAVNRGRGFARQKALELAGGQFLCMLDADDWYYPDKLERQLAIMQAEPELALVSMGMAIVDEQNALCGVRTWACDVALVKRHGASFQTTGFAFAPSMIRTELARATGFDARLRRSEDWDFLMRLLAGRSYAVMPEIGYVYRELYSAHAMREALDVFGHQRQVLLKSMAAAPAPAAAEYVKTYLKSAVYKAGLLTQTGRALFTRRNTRATPEQQAGFQRARGRVEACLATPSP